MDAAAKDFRGSGGTPLGRTRAKPGRAILSKVKHRFEVMFHFLILMMRISDGGEQGA